MRSRVREISEAREIEQFRARVAFYSPEFAILAASALGLLHQIHA